jgi:hypothetical protein
MKRFFVGFVVDACNQVPSLISGVPFEFFGPSSFGGAVACFGSSKLTATVS